MNEDRTHKCLRQVEHIRGSVVSLLAATLYQGNPDRNHKLWNITSTERYILHMQALLDHQQLISNYCLQTDHQQPIANIC